MLSKESSRQSRNCGKPWANRDVDRIQQDWRLRRLVWPTCGYFLLHLEASPVSASGNGTMELPFPINIGACRRRFIPQRGTAIVMRYRFFMLSRTSWR
jgi:hypothetical protein